MQNFYLNYKFTLDTILDLDLKYTNGIDLEKTRLFLYSNTFNIIKMYDLSHPFSNKKYSILDKFYSDKYKFIVKSINYIKENGYYKNDILFLYSIVLSDFLNKHLDSILDIKNIAKIDLEYAKYNSFNLNYKNMYKSFSKNYLYTLTDLDYITTIFKSLYQFPIGDRYMKISLKKFKEISKRNPFLITKYKFYDKFILKNVKYRDFLYKRIKKKDIISFEFNGINLIDSLSKLKSEALILLNNINDALYLNNLKGLKEYFNIPKKE